MITTMHIVRWIARVAWLGAITLGLLFWITGIELTTFHMLFGLTLTLSLLFAGIVLVSTRGARLLGAAGIVYALILHLFGMTQSSLLVGNLHWLIQGAHLLVGIGAIALVQRMIMHYERLKQQGISQLAPQEVAIRAKR